MIELLCKENTDIARLRASMLLNTSDPERALALAATALTNRDLTLRLMAKAQLATLNALAAWKLEHPSIVLEPAVTVLEAILKELKTSAELSALSLEVIVRIHGVLTDAYNLLENFDAAKQHASEVFILAKPLGLYSLIPSAMYQLASIAYFQGQSVHAEQLFQKVVDDPSSSAMMLERAHRSRAFTLSDLGDDDGAEACLAELGLGPHQLGYWQMVSVQFLTLRHRWTESTDGYLAELPHASAAMLTCFRHIVEAQGLPPDRSDERFARYTAAYNEIHPLLQSAVTWRKIDHQVTASFISLQLGEFSLALQRFPALTAVLELPPAPRVRALCVGLEIMERHLPLTSKELWEIASLALRELQAMPGRIVEQVARRLQLLTPLAAAVLARLPNCPDALVALGYQTMLNLKARPYAVYDVKGVRPIQAARYILTTFDHDTDFIGRLGGGQLDSLRKALYRKFYGRYCWYQPIPAARVAHVLLCCREIVEVATMKAHLTGSVSQLKRRFGYVPRLLKVDRIPDLEKIAYHLDLFARGKNSAITATKALFGKENQV